MYELNDQESSFLDGANIFLEENLPHLLYTQINAEIDKYVEGYRSVKQVISAVKHLSENHGDVGVELANEILYFMQFLLNVNIEDPDEEPDESEQITNKLDQRVDLVKYRRQVVSNLEVYDVHLDTNEISQLNLLCSLVLRKDVKNRKKCSTVLSNLLDLLASGVLTARETMTLLEGYIDVYDNSTSAKISSFLCAIERDCYQDDPKSVELSSLRELNKRITPGMIPNTFYIAFQQERYDYYDELDDIVDVESMLVCVKAAMDELNRYKYRCTPSKFLRSILVTVFGPQASHVDLNLCMGSDVYVKHVLKALGDFNDTLLAFTADEWPKKYKRLNNLIQENDESLHEGLINFYINDKSDRGSIVTTRAPNMSLDDWKVALAHIHERIDGMVHKNKDEKTAEIAVFTTYLLKFFTESQDVNGGPTMRKIYVSKRLSCFLRLLFHLGAYMLTSKQNLTVCNQDLGYIYKTNRIHYATKMIESLASQCANELLSCRDTLDLTDNNIPVTVLSKIPGPRPRQVLMVEGMDIGREGLFKGISK